MSGATPATEVATLREALESMVMQFAYWVEGPTGGYWTGGLSALEDAFAVLGWDDPHPAPEAECDEPGCHKQSSCGTPVPMPTRYRRTCGDHRPEFVMCVFCRHPSPHEAPCLSPIHFPAESICDCTAVFEEKA